VHSIILADMIPEHLTAAITGNNYSCAIQMMSKFSYKYSYIPLKCFLCSNMRENNKLNLTRFWVLWNCLHIHRSYTNF